MNTISLAALTVLDAGPAGQIQAAAEAGFDAVGLRLNPFVPSDRAIVGDPTAEAEIEQLLADTAIGVLEIGVFPVRPHTDFDRLKSIIAFSARIGARYLVCPVEDPDQGRRVQTFAGLCELANAFGLSALIEFNPYSACPNLKCGLELVRSAQQPNSGLCVDAFHLSRSGGHPDDLRGIDAALLPLVHFCDAAPPRLTPMTKEELRAESRTSRCLPGEGGLWLGELLRALPSDIAISVEAPTARHAGLPPVERARLALAATRRVLSAPALNS
jgi:sugar phosphate isomerase/epimerase